MTSSRIAAVLIVALHAFSSCGGGCGRGAPEGQAHPSTTAAPSHTTTTAPVKQGKTYRLDRPRRWKVGDVATCDLTTVSTGRVTEIAPGMPPSRVPPTKATVHTTWIEKTAAVDDDGNRLRYQVFFPSWTRTQADALDESLEKAVITVSGTGKARTWSFAKGDPKLTDQGRDWLDEHFGSRGPGDVEWLRVMLPATDVAVGESWSPDPRLLGNELTEVGLELDAATVAATASLRAIEQGSARCSFHVTFALRRFPHTGVELSKGTMTLEGEMSAPVEPDVPSPTMLRVKVTFEGEASKDGTRAQYEFATDERSTTMPGGDFMEPAS